MSGFTADERERIDTALREAGRELFARYGLSKTTIADLTGEVGIAAGTFYQFYDSKEALYLAVLDDEGEAVAAAVVPPLEDGDPEAGLREFLGRLCDEIETNPLVANLLTGGALDRLRRTMTSEERERDRQESLAYIIPFVERWQAAGRLPEADPAVVAGAVRGATFITLHQEDLGDRYPEIRSVFLDAFAAGLVD